MDDRRLYYVRVVNGRYVNQQILTKSNRVRFFNSHGVVVDYVEETLCGTFEAELVKDLLSLITVFLLNYMENVAKKIVNVLRK